MAQPTIQNSFNSGEWSPNLWARTDIEKYHSGAALLQNFFVDYRGGASTRVGTKYCLRAYNDGVAVRMIPFQASFGIKYAMEFGQQYIRFFVNGLPVLESGLSITAATKANPCVLTVTNTYTTGDVDWIYVTGVSGMTQLNGNYYKVHARDATHVTLYDLFGNPVDSTGFGTYTANGTTQRIYKLNTDIQAADLATLKFVQNVNTMVLTHPNYKPRTLTYTSPTSWALTDIVFGSTATQPAFYAITASVGPGQVTCSYVATSIDGNGQESDISTPIALVNYLDIRVVSGSVQVYWLAIPGATSYNVYKAVVSYTGPIPVGAPYGFIGNTKATTLIDSNIAPDFSQPPPTYANPFVGSGVSAVTIVTPGTYSSAPTATFGAAPAGGVTAVGTPLLHIITVAVQSGGTGYIVGDLITLPNGILIQVLTLTGSAVATAAIMNAGSATALPANPLGQIVTSGVGTGATFNVTWGVYDINITNNGSGYLVAPTVTFSAGAAAATAVLGARSSGNPSVPAFFQQRLVLAAPLASPQTLYMSRPGLYYNYDVSTPVQDDDAITATIVSGQLNNIKALIPQPGGLIVLTDGSSFLINGGSLGSAVTPASITSNAQSFLGCNDMPPIVVNYDILYVQSKGSSVRDASYNFYANVFTGADISVLSSHLFFGYQLLEWAWAEEPYKIVWAVRNDGTLLSLTFIKEQEFIGWAHHVTTGFFLSVCSIVEAASVGFQNFLYTVVQRTVQGQTVKYIERMEERATTGLVKDFWTVDAGLQYSGAPATTFFGGQHLSGLTCTGLADGQIIPAFVMPASGTFVLGTAASKVTVGLAFEADLQTLYIDLGQPTVQSKDKKIPVVTLRVTETLGLKIGSAAANLVDMKDLIRGNVGQNTNTVVTDLVTGDATTTIDPKWQEQGQIYLRQPYPYPASVLGVIQQVAIGDTAK